MVTPKARGGDWLVWREGKCSGREREEKRRQGRKREFQREESISDFIREHPYWADVVWFCET